MEAAAMSDTSRLIVLTGATRGLGRALAERFAATGHRVMGCGRSADRLAALAALPGGPHEFAALDVADDAQVAEWAEGILDRQGPPDLLINNAAIINANAPLWEVSSDAMEAIVRVNILGVANTIRHFVPAMVRRGSGVIVNFSSYWGRSAAPKVAPYCATKWAVEGLTQALAQELPKKMAAVPLNPGIIDTDMLRSTFGGAAGGYLEPDEWSRVAAPFLLGLGPEHNGKPQTVPGQ
jgi:NAD(P)-dependent dehydrogenase (short-subunit alcohol dehydrogenase family)